MASNRPLPDWDNMKFGFIETDYMFISQTGADMQWDAGAIKPFQDLQISPVAAVLNYGQGMFEGLKALRTPEDKIVLFRPEENARRFRMTAARMAMPPYPVGRFVNAVQDVVKANARWIPSCNPEWALDEQCTLYIRPVMMGSGPMLGLNPAPSYTFYIYVSPVGRYLSGDVKVMVLDSSHRAAPHGTGGVKTIGNYAGTLRPRQAVAALGYKDVLYLDARHDRYVEELATSNFFAILPDNTLITPNLSGSILPGITRDSVMTIAREVFGWRVVERAIEIEEVLAHAEETFCTGTAAVVQPVVIINYRGTDYPIGSGKTGERTMMLRNYLVQVQMQQKPDLWGWTQEVTV